MADEIGYQDLIDRLGLLTPNGFGITATQVEAGPGNYSPDPLLPEFLGKTFSAMSGTSAVSWHASEVARNWYGIGYGMAWGTTSIYNYEAGNWAQAGYLKMGSGTTVPPELPPGNTRVFNCSWIGSFGNNWDKETLRRADFAMQRDFTLVIAGENNGAGSALSPLMCMGYNGLAVGVTSGLHSAGPTAANMDGPGRQKPEIVAPAQWTSFSTPIVSAAASMLYQTASLPPLDADPWARRGLVIKGALLAGAKHRPTWANNAPTSGADRGVATQSLDPIFGVDTVNINRSHLILTSGRTITATTPDSVESAPLNGWMQSTFPGSSQNTAMYAQFNLTTIENTVSIVCTWNRYVSSSQFTGSTAAPVLPNLDLTLYRKLKSGALVELSGPAGARFFDSGNCASRSVVDNVEHIFLRNLDAGTYVLEAKRIDAGGNSAQTCVSWFIDTGALFGDIDLDGHVDGSDLGLLLGGWGVGGASDLDESGTTDGSDLGLLLGAWEGGHH